MTKLYSTYNEHNHCNPIALLLICIILLSPQSMHNSPNTEPPTFIHGTTNAAHTIISSVSQGKGKSVVWLLRKVATS